MKKPGKFVIFTLGVLLLAFIVWIVLAVLNKWDIMASLTSDRAIVAYFIVAIYLTFCGYILVINWRDRK